MKRRPTSKMKLRPALLPGPRVSKAGGKMILQHVIEWVVLNGLVCRSLAGAGFLAIKEPPGPYRSNGEIPDRFTLFSWRNGRSLISNVTVTDMAAALPLAAIISHRSVPLCGAAELAASSKVSKYT